MKHFPFSLPLCLAAACTLPTLALEAGMILVDLGNDSSFRGVSVSSPDTNGNYWTSVWSGAFYSDLVDTSGTPTTIDIGFLSGAVGGTDSYNGPAGATGSATLAADLLNTDIDAAALGNLGGTLAGAFDYYVNSALSIQGLDPLKTYELTLFGSRKYTTDATTVYTLYADSPGGIGNPNGADVIDVASLDVRDPSDDSKHNRDTVTKITFSGDNGVYLGFTGDSGGSGYLNALSIAVVPEPGTLMPLMLLSLGVVMTRRRRSV